MSKKTVIFGISKTKVEQKKDNITTMGKSESKDELECDYDVQPTNIYLLIKECNWKGVIYQADFYPSE
jgi:hypothetical protein